MIYSPKLDSVSNRTLKSLSNAIGEPMTRTIKEMIKFLPLLMNSEKICADCEDKSQCNDCFFSQKNKEDLKSELFTEVIEKANLKDEFCTARLSERTKPKKEKEPTLCKACEKKVKKYKKRQANQQQEESKEWKPEDGPFLEK